MEADSTFSLAFFFVKLASIQEYANVMRSTFGLQLHYCSLGSFLETYYSQACNSGTCSGG